MIGKKMKKYAKRDKEIASNHKHVCKMCKKEWFGYDLFCDKSYRTICCRCLSIFFYLDFKKHLQNTKKELEKNGTTQATHS